MLTASDLVHLPYNLDLTEGGIAFACQSLACTCDRLGDSPVGHLQRIVGRVAAELAFRRQLAELAVPYKVLRATPFTHPDQYDVSLGRHRCIVKSFLITRRNQIAQIRQDPGILLQAPALLPVEQFAAEDNKPDDLYIFAFLLGIVTTAAADVDKAIAAGQPACLIHLLPEDWARPGNLILLEKLALKSECETSVAVEIGGQDAGRNFINSTLELPPRQRVVVEKNFYSLAYLCAHCRPEARIGLHSPVRGEAHIVRPHEWGNIWVYGMDVFLAGWLTHEDFRRKASVLNAGAHTFQVDCTRTKNLLVPVGELNPLGTLLEKVKTWELEKRNSYNVTEK